MKTISKQVQKSVLIVCTLFVFSCLIFLSNCAKTDVVPESDRVSTLLKSVTWKIMSVTIDGTSNNSFSGMTLSFTDTGYSTSNGGVVWPSSGSWKFTDLSAKVIKRNDGLEINIDSISETSLTLSLMWSKTTLGGGREESIAGKHVFTFKK